MAIWIDNECLGDVNKADAIRWIDSYYNQTVESMKHHLWNYLEGEIQVNTSNVLIEEDYTKFTGYILYPYMTNQISKETWKEYRDKMYNVKEKLLR